jgi:hypothetical protein
MKGKRGRELRQGSVEEKGRRSSVINLPPKRINSTEIRVSRFAELDAMIAVERRRIRRPSKISPEVLRLANTIRNEVTQFRRGHQNIDQEFQGWFGGFRADHARNAKWYAEVEPIYKTRWNRADVKLGPRDRWTAMSVANYARLLHEEGKYGEAARNLTMARKRYVIAEPMLDDERAIILDWIDKALAACTDCVAPEVNPEYRVPLTRPG